MKNGITTKMVGLSATDFSEGLDAFKGMAKLLGDDKEIVTMMREVLKEGILEDCVSKLNNLYR